MCLMRNGISLKIPPSFILGGDFNEYNQVFGSSFTEPKDRFLLEATHDNNLVCLNTGLPIMVKNIN